MITSSNSEQSSCVHWVLNQRCVCMCTTGVLSVWLLMCTGTCEHGVCVCSPYPGLCVSCVLFMTHVYWCVRVAVHTNVSCWVSLVVVPHHCSVPSGLCCWLHSPLLFCCAAICFVLSSVLLDSILLLKGWQTGTHVKGFASVHTVYFMIQIIFCFDWFKTQSWIVEGLNCSHDKFVSFESSIFISWKS